ncbi:MAG TPA: glycosyltransferase [Polyangiaceae bacterium]|nr:glycosyltransferase [Polyangiaceae bacterium]
MSPFSADALRVGFVSTFPPMRCAIGIYTQKLGEALLESGEARPFVAAEDDGSGEIAPGPLEVARVYRRDEDYGDRIYEAVRSAGCHVAHFQYAPDLFGEDERLPSLVERLDRAGVRPLVTLHTVYGARLWRRFMRRPTTRSFHRALADHGQLVVHHSVGMESELLRQGISPRKITVIPHGTTVAETAPVSRARAALGVPEDAFLFTFFGFIHRLKNVHTAVEGFLRAAEDMPRARLLVVGMPWGDRWYNHLYVGAIRARVALSAERARVEIRDEYVAPERVADVYAASDVVLLPHRQSYGSASGVFHQAVGFRRPVLTARGPKFVEAKQLFRDLDELTVPAASAGAWARAMRRVYTDESLREAARSAVEGFAQRTSWPTVAAEHASLYRRLLEPRPIAV